MAAAPRPPKLLSGGNPQIPKGDGDAPVQAYIAALPEWKHDTGRQIDELIAAAVPDVRRAVKWNSPFYGAPGRDDWFLSIHAFAKYLKLTFFEGAGLDPAPPGASKSDGVRYLDVYAAGFDAAQLRAWIEQAAELPGWKP